MKGRSRAIGQEVARCAVEFVSFGQIRAAAANLFELKELPDIGLDVRGEWHRAASLVTAFDHVANPALAEPTSLWIEANQTDVHNL